VLILGKGMPILYHFIRVQRIGRSVILSVDLIEG